MYHIDVSKVKGKMAEKGYTQSALSNELDISANTLRTYLNSPFKIPYDVVCAMAKLLCDNREEIITIFFAS